MIPNTTPANSFANNSAESAAFGLSLQDSAHIMGILRSNIYSDNILAVIREYSANAWDAHRMVGKGDVPIKVVLPDYYNRNFVFSVQDFGPGLSHNDVFKTFTQYGASSKRETDLAVGMLGIGSKSAFSYTDSFTVVSCHGGSRRTYLAALDDSGVGSINLLTTEPCGDETGLTIKVDVKPNDCGQFQAKAHDFFEWFEPTPIGVSVAKRYAQGSQLEQAGLSLRFKSGVLAPHCGNIAVMGCVAYKFDYRQMDQAVADETHTKTPSILFFDIGEVDISASREELRYTAKTKLALANKFNALLDEAHTAIEAKLAACATPWERKLAGAAFASWGPAFQENYSNYCYLKKDQAFKTFEGPSFVKFDVGRNWKTNETAKVTKTPVSNFELASNVEVMVHEANSRSLAGYAEGYQDSKLPRVCNLFITRLASYTQAEFEADLKRFLDVNGLTGIKVTYLTDAHWSAPRVKPKKTYARAKAWKLSGATWLHVSDKAEVDKEDHYVLLSDLKVEGTDYGQEGKFSYEIVNEIKYLQNLAAEVGYKFNVYGYRLSSSVKGRIGKKLDLAKIKADIEAKVKANIEKMALSHYLNMSALGQPQDANLAKLQKELGEAHPLTCLVKAAVETNHMDAHTYHQIPWVMDLIRKQPNTTTFVKRYFVTDFSQLNQDSTIETIKALDFYRKAKLANPNAV